MERLLKEILDNTNRYNRNKNNKWFREKFDELVKLFPFKVETFNEAMFIVDNDLKQWPACKICGNDVKKLEKVYCSTKCSANDPDKKRERIETLKKTNKDNPEIIEKRTKSRKETISKKSEDEMELWRDRMSTSAKEREKNATDEWLEERAKKLSESTKRYFSTISLDEYNKRLKNIRKGKIENGIIKLDNRDFDMYSRLARNLTTQQYRKYKEIINPNNLPRGLYSGEDLYHLDHIVSIKDGFDNNIPIHIISSIHNLQMLLVEENCSKNAKSDMVIEMLLKHF